MQFTGSLAVMIKDGGLAGLALVVLPHFSTFSLKNSTKTLRTLMGCYRDVTQRLCRANAASHFVACL